MGFLPSILVFSALATIPIYSPTLLSIIVGTFGFGLIGQMVTSYAIPFFLNWIVNFGSDYWYYYSNCTGIRTAPTSSIIMASMIPGLISAIFGFVLNFIPILKTPLLLFAIGGGMWIVEVIINIIGNYGLSSGITFVTRASFLKNSCKKEEEK